MLNQQHRQQSIDELIIIDVHMAVYAVSSKSDLRGKRGTFIYDMTACRELVLVTDADGSDLPPQNPDAKPPVPPDPVNMLGRGQSSHLCLLSTKLRVK